MSAYNIFQPTDEEKRLIIIALETIQICQQGTYKKGNTIVPLNNEQYRDFEQVIPYSPKLLKEIQSLQKTKSRENICKIRVINSDSFEAAKALDKPLVMNFANPYRPGGGFLYGAKAQEESLCRSGTLYSSISSEKASVMYKYNRTHSSAVNSDYMLLSPEVCVFRNSNGDMLDKPYYVSVITVSAPDKNYEEYWLSEKETNQIIKTRIGNLCAVAIKHNYHSLVLGAWECGAFGNDVHNVAECFYEILIERNYASYFNEIVFAIWKDQQKLDVFTNQFKNYI